MQVIIARLLVLAAAALLVILVLAAPAFAQAQIQAPPADQMERCSQLGIEPEKCTEQAILGKECLGMSCNQQKEEKIDSIVVSILAGCAAAFVAGIVYVKRTSHEKSNQKPQ
jgi:hypothetical protein